MILIRRGKEPDSLLQYRKSTPNACYEELPTKPREDIRRQMWNEQKGLCAYCMRHIKRPEITVQGIREGEYIPRLIHWIIRVCWGCTMETASNLLYIPTTDRNIQYGASFCKLRVDPSIPVICFVLATEDHRTLGTVRPCLHDLQHVIRFLLVKRADQPLIQNEQIHFPVVVDCFTECPVPLATFNSSRSSGIRIYCTFLNFWQAAFPRAQAM